MDGMSDLPIVHYFDADFAERYPDSGKQPVSRAEGDNQARYAANLLLRPQARHSWLARLPHVVAALSNEHLQVLQVLQVVAS